MYIWKSNLEIMSHPPTFLIQYIEGINCRQILSRRETTHVIQILNTCMSDMYYVPNTNQKYKTIDIKTSSLQSVAYKSSYSELPPFPGACSDGSPKQVSQSSPRFQIFQSSPKSHKLHTSKFDLQVSFTIRIVVPLPPALARGYPQK